MVDVQVDFTGLVRPTVPNNERGESRDHLRLLLFSAFICCVYIVYHDYFRIIHNNMKIVESRNSCLFLLQQLSRSCLKL